MSLATLRALHAILADALDDIQRVYTPEHGGPPVEEPLGATYASSYASPPPSPSTSGAPLDFPSLDAPYDPSDAAEQLTSHPVVVRAINRIVAAAGQMAVTVQPPFYALCDAAMGYHLPSCLRLLEVSHTVELLREAGPEGLHVDLISQRNGVETGKLAHVLRLLATHHFIRERSPNVFATNRISSFMDSGKSFEDIKNWEREGRPEMKYHDTNGVAAFIGMCTDELFKSSAYLTEAYLLARTEPPRPPFEYAFRTDAGFFAWLEGEGAPVLHGFETGNWRIGKGEEGNSNKFRLERFGTAMSGTGSWEAPGAVFNGGCFDWRALSPGSIVVDVGGGIGSTSMLLANAFSRSGTSTSMFPPPSSPGNRGETSNIEDLGLKFVIQDREVVVAMGEKAWRAKCPELLDSGTVQFKVHDFFTPQPIKNAAVFFLRVILHDWPDAAARHILLHLREAATPDTKLVLADFVLPLACADVDVDGGAASEGVLEGVEGAESMLASAPLLANLGKASANAYWMDLTMQVTFNAQERTLRETTALALSAGWKVVKVTCAPGSLFGHIVAVPAPIPVQHRAAGSGSTYLDVPSTSSFTNKVMEEGVCRRKGELDVIERASSRCGTPTFGSRTDLPSMQEAMARFGGGITRPRSRLPALVGRPGAGPPPTATTTMRPGILKQPAVITSTSTSPSARKKKPSPLSFPNPLSSSPSPVSPRPLASPRLSQPASPIKRRMSLAQLRTPSQQGATSPVPPVPRQAPPSPMSPRHSQPPPLPPQRTLTRRASHAHLTSHHSLSTSANLPPSPSLPSRYSHTPTPTPATPTPRPRTRTLSRAMSHAQLYQSAHAVSGQAGHHTSIPMPIRQTQDAAPAPHPSPSLSYSPRTPATPAGRPATPRYASPPIARRASFAQLPQTTLRKRSGSIIVPPIYGTGAGIGGAISMMGTGLLLGRGAALNFGEGSVKSKEGAGEGEGKGEGEESEPAFGGAGSVLAAAARIERGVGVLSSTSHGRLELNDDSEDVIS